MELNLGNLFLRHHCFENWSNLELGFATRPSGGLARRETALKLCLKSDHAIELLSVENPADRYVAPDGSITYGRLCVQGKHQFAITAEQVFTAQLFDRTMRVAKERAESDLQRELINVTVPPIDLDGAAAA